MNPAAHRLGGETFRLHPGGIVYAGSGQGHGLARTSEGRIILGLLDRLDNGASGFRHAPLARRFPRQVPPNHRTRLRAWTTLRSDLWQLHNPESAYPVTANSTQYA